MWRNGIGLNYSVDWFGLVWSGGLPKWPAIHGREEELQKGTFLID